MAGASPATYPDYRSRRSIKGFDQLDPWRGIKYRSQKAGKNIIQIIRAKLIHMGCAFVPRFHNARLTQDSEMMGHAGFGSSSIKRCTCRFTFAGKLPHNRKPDGVTQSMEN